MAHCHPDAKFFTEGKQARKHVTVQGAQRRKIDECNAGRGLILLEELLEEWDHRGLGLSGSCRGNQEDVVTCQDRIESRSLDGRGLDESSLFHRIKKEGMKTSPPQRPITRSRSFLIPR